MSTIIFIFVMALLVRFAVSTLRTKPPADPPYPTPPPSMRVMPPPAVPPAVPVPPSVVSTTTPALSAPPAPDVPTSPAATDPRTPVPPTSEPDPDIDPVLSGPQLVPLSADQQARVLDYMAQGYEVMAVRLVCDETRAGILDAQKTVRTLAGLPSPY